MTFCNTCLQCKTATYAVQLIPELMHTVMLSYQQALQRLNQTRVNL